MIHFISALFTLTSPSSFLILLICFLSLFFLMCLANSLSISSRISFQFYKSLLLFTFFFSFISALIFIIFFSSAIFGAFVLLFTSVLRVNLGLMFFLFLEVKLYCYKFSSQICCCFISQVLSHCVFIIICSEFFDFPFDLFSNLFIIQKCVV